MTMAIRTRWPRQSSTGSGNTSPRTRRWRSPDWRDWIEFQEQRERKKPGKPGFFHVGAAGRNRTADLRITKAHEINFYIIVFVVFIIAHSLYILRFGAKMGQ